MHPHTFLITRIRNVLQQWHSGKDRNCDVCLRTKIKRAPFRRRTGEAVPRAEKFGDLITADHKVLSEKLITASKQSPIRSRGTRSCHSMGSILSAQNRRRKRVDESFSNRQKSRKSFALTIHLNSANPLKIYHGLIALHHLFDPRQMALLQEQCTE